MSINSKISHYLENKDKIIENIELSKLSNEEKSNYKSKLNEFCELMEYLDSKKDNSKGLNEYSAVFFLKSKDSNGFSIEEKEKIIFKSKEKYLWKDLKWESWKLVEGSLTHPSEEKATANLLELSGPNGKMDLEGKIIQSSYSKEQALVGAKYSEKEFYAIFGGYISPFE